jgi:polyferredoxin
MKLLNILGVLFILSAGNEFINFISQEPPSAGGLAGVGLGILLVLAFATWLMRLKSKDAAPAKPKPFYKTYLVAILLFVFFTFLSLGIKTVTKGGTKNHQSSTNPHHPSDF